MESYPSKSEVKSVESHIPAEIKVSRVRDSDLKGNWFIGPHNSFQEVVIDESTVKKAKASDIQQKKHNNCFLLSVLSSILQNKPSLISNIMVIREDKKLQFTFYDFNDLRKKYVYIIDPSIVKSPTMNEHTNPLIYMFEKAFAIHMLLTQDEKLTEEQKRILQAWRSNNFDDEKTIQHLSKKATDIENNKIMLTEVKGLCDYPDYHHALERGYGHEVFSMFFGSQSQIIDVNIHHNFHYMTNDFINLLHVGAINKNEQEILTKMFGSIDSAEAKYFLDSIQKTDFMMIFKLNILFENLTPDNQRSKHQLLKEAFEKHINWLPVDVQFKGRVLNLINNFIDRELPHKRGLALYTDSEQRNYQSIFKALQSYSLVTISTRRDLGKGQIVSFHKGLYDKHEYSVVNCYEKNGRKYLVLYNPHGRNEREYQEDKTGRLHAKAREKPSIFQKLFLLAAKKDIVNLALPMAALDPNASGYFELELTDLKNFYKISISGETQQLINLPRKRA